MATRVVINEGALARVEREAAIASMEVAAPELLSLAIDECPVDTGRLRASLTAEVSGSSLLAGGGSARVGSALDYAILVEEGTRHVPPNPFLRRALAALGGVLRGRWS